MRDSVAPGKRWAWDNWDDDESALGTALSIDTPAPEISGAAVESIQEKVGLMRRELAELEQECASLKAAVARRKTSDDRVVRQIEESWLRRIEGRVKEHKAAAGRQAKFKDELEASNKQILERLEGLKEVLKYKEANAKGTIDAAKRENKEAMEAAREEWLSSEKVRLKRLADAKSNSLMKDAVKALEPELHRLISGNKLDLQQRGDALEEVFEAYQKERERETEAKLRSERARIEEEASADAERLRRSQSEGLLQLSEAQERELKSVRDEWKSEMERERSSFEAERRKRSSLYTNEIDEARSVEQERFAKLQAQHDRDMRALSEEKEEAVSAERDRVDGDLERWQRQRIVEIRSEQAERDKETERLLLEQSDAELELVIAKLDAQAVEERGRVDRECQESVDTVVKTYHQVESKMAEEEALLMDRYAVEREKIALAQEEVSELEAQVVGAERASEEAEERLRTERARTGEILRECRERVESLKVSHQRSVDLASKEVEGHTRQLGDLVITLEDARPVHDKEIERMERRFARELEDVEERVRRVIERKDNAIKEKEKELKEVTLEGKRLAQELEEWRRKDITGNT